MYQGSTLTPVRMVVERVGGTDITLVKLNDGMEFRNEFFGSGFVPRCLVHGNDIKWLEKLMLDSFTTGQQELANVGVRVELDREPGPNTRISKPPRTATSTRLFQASRMYGHRRAYTLQARTRCTSSRSFGIVPVVRCSSEVVVRSRRTGNGRWRVPGSPCCVASLWDNALRQHITPGQV